MGQYYKVVNLDKRQLITPWNFCDGAKLLEFGCSGNGTMCALAVLTASGNGRGGGDLSITHESKTNPLPKMREDQRVEWQSEITDSKGDKTCIAGIVPTVVGSWAGDRIVIAGDYDDPGKFLTREIIREWCISKGWASTAVENGHKVQDGDRETDFSDPNLCPNLYHIAGDLFEDVSERVLRAMCDDKYVREDMVKFFSEYDHTPPEFLRKAVKKAKKAEMAFREKFPKLFQQSHSPEETKSLQEKFICEANNFTDDEMRKLMGSYTFDPVNIIRLLLDKKTFGQQTAANLGNVDWNLLRYQKNTLVEFYQRKNIFSSIHPCAELDEALSGIVHLLDNLQDQAALQLGEEVVFGKLMETL